MTTPDVATVGNRPGRGADEQGGGFADGVARLRRALRRACRAADPGNPLAVAQLELMSALAERPGARPGQLARLLHLRPNTITTVVNALARHGLVDREAGDTCDRRAVALSVNDAGRQVVHAWQATNAAVLHIALSSLLPAQRRTLTRAVPALEALADAVERLADAPHRPVPPAGDSS